MVLSKYEIDDEGTMVCKLVVATKNPNVPKWRGEMVTCPDVPMNLVSDLTLSSKTEIPE
jgi:hypothetical protein